MGGRYPASARGKKVGLTGGRGSSLNLFGGVASIVAAASSAGIHPDLVLEASPHQPHIEQLLDALQHKARVDIDLTFPGSFDIRAWLDTPRPSWVPPRRATINGKDNCPAPAYLALKTRFEAAYNEQKVALLKTLTGSVASKIGSNDRRVEHMALTGAAMTTKDALAIVWSRKKGLESGGK